MVASPETSGSFMPVGDNEAPDPDDAFLPGGDDESALSSGAATVDDGSSPERSDIVGDTAANGVESESNETVVLPTAPAWRYVAETNVPEERTSILKARAMEVEKLIFSAYPRHRFSEEFVKQSQQFADKVKATPDVASFGRFGTDAALVRGHLQGDGAKQGLVTFAFEELSQRPFKEVFDDATEDPRKMKALMVAAVCMREEARQGAASVKEIARQHADSDAERDFQKQRVIRTLAADAMARTAEAYLRRQVQGEEGIVKAAEEGTNYLEDLERHKDRFSQYASSMEMPESLRKKMQATTEMFTNAQAKLVVGRGEDEVIRQAEESADEEAFLSTLHQDFADRKTAETKSRDKYRLFADAAHMIVRAHEKLYPKHGWHAAAKEALTAAQDIHDKEVQYEEDSHSVVDRGEVLGLEEVRELHPRARVEYAAKVRSAVDNRAWSRLAETHDAIDELRENNVDVLAATGFERTLKGADHGLESEEDAGRLIRRQRYLEVLQEDLEYAEALAGEGKAQGTLNALTTNRVQPLYARIRTNPFKPTKWILPGGKADVMQAREDAADLLRTVAANPHMGREVGEVGNAQSEDMLIAIADRLDKLNAQLIESSAKKEALARDTGTVMRYIGTAGKLVGKLLEKKESS